ncbi:hypothetical protein E8E15_004732 [Penicillium rubens]|jgi:hypothetical protein|uniref:Uncharacterized protein n=2 Tax=Penicillium chrysogenum species complex TaxID=254878 RepID=B6HCC9_PENRW|nr:uncharacterized protein N7525_000429 [Penicillium rubens]KZN92258.1 hypothetical protein EN45_024120 [Penicillium chrysogenum]CAP94807.1 hypothetical protein PCH_Pc18g05830 [Penicillium rubens Wisconsin 54-1255]KAF3014609.1 hypothetical protein E8E15_004732 [Penicillium rubens]KAJ5039831.1 hypothetical protein NUH16_009624 [Penicillium rubens]KAJ5842688.1 hypothetical protein N7525_000429 [Penicillium rubens]
MATPQRAKRARSNTIGDVHINETAAPPEEISRRIKHLDPDTVDNILTQAAQIHPDVMSMVDDAIRVIREKEQNRVLSFDHYSSSVWKSINVTYRSMRGGAQYDVSFEVAQEVVGTIKSITEQCGPLTNPRTRFNGLSVLRKIGKTIALSSNDTVGHEVQKRFQWDACLVTGMLEILDSMTADEVRAIREDESRPEALWPKLQELEELSHDYCIHPGLVDVLNRVESDGYEDEEGDEEGYEEEYEEGDEEGYEEEYEEGDEEGYENEVEENDLGEAQP